MSQTVEVVLPYSTLYVSGTVNGVLVTWTNISGNTWQAEAERAADEIYVIELSVTNESGLVSNHSTVLFYSGLNLITNRTAQDVARWQALRDKGWTAMTDEEKAEWLGAMKGCYGYTDMNRVEGAVALLAQKVSALGYLYSPTVKMNWTRQDVPTRADFERYLGNVEGLRNAIPVFPSTPSAPNIYSRLNYRSANELEEILLDVDLIANNIPKTWHFAGEINVGEV